MRNAPAQQIPHRTRSINVGAEWESIMRTAPLLDTLRKTSSKRRLSDRSAQSESHRTRSAKRSAISKRSVCFEVDELNNVKEYTERTPIHLYLNDETISELWWSKDELSDIMEREQNVFEVFSKCCSAYVDTVLRVWEQCNACESASDDSASQPPVVLAWSDVEKIANAPARGMENDVVIMMRPGFRKKAIRSVMETQRAMANASTRTRSNAMRRRYKNVSRAASMFAKSIADGDAQIATALHDDL